MNNIDNKANALAIIEKNSRDFGGDLDDTQCAAAANISPKTFYKYKFQLRVQKLMREAQSKMSMPSGAKSASFSASLNMLRRIV